MSAACRHRFAIAISLLASLFFASAAHAQQVFTGDPVDPGTSLAYPVMPGLPLLLPGDDEDFGTSDDVVNTTITGDVDLVARAGTIPAGAIPPPSGAPGGPALLVAEAGGGTTGQGAETPVTVHVSNGAGTYGSTLTAADLNNHPVTVYAFADLDNDGIVGPTNGDGTLDNELERQEAFAYAGRQVGSIAAGRMLGSLGVSVAAPASIGGLRVGLVAAAWTGTDADRLFSDGTPIYTRWPLFPPLDPDRVIGGGNPPAPDSALPSEIKWDLERNYLPPPSHPTLGTAFALPLDGSSPTTDQFVSVSGPVHAARFMTQLDAASFRARSRSLLRPAPETSGSGRVLVVPVAHLDLASNGSQSVRLLPVDLLGNVADPTGAGITVVLTAVGPVRIESPDNDADASFEAIDIADAAGALVTLAGNGSGSARIDLTSGARVLDSLAVTVAGSGDRDGDAADDDGNASGVAIDNPCENADSPGFSCDDNCALTSNSSQNDSDRNGLGDCCDGTCVADPEGNDCGQCTFVGPPPSGAHALSMVRVRVKANAAGDSLKLRARFAQPSEGIAPDAEMVSLEILHGATSAYSAALDAAIEQISSKPKYRYDDPAAQIDGVRRVDLQMTGSGMMRMSWKVEAADLSALSTGTTRVLLAIGDDDFAAVVQCAQHGSNLSCRP